MPTLFYTEHSQRELAAIPQSVRIRILAAIRSLQLGSKRQTKKLKGRRGDAPLYRRRVGSYRIIYTVEKPNQIIILHIRHRKDAYT